MCAKNWCHQRDKRNQEGTHFWKGTNKVLRMGVVPGRVWRRQGLRHGTNSKKALRRQLASAAGKKLPVTILEINNLEIEHELACSAMCFSAQSVWTGQWKEGVREAWKRQVWETYVVEESQRTGRSSFLWCERSWNHGPKMADFEDGRWQNVQHEKTLPRRC